MPVSGQTPTRIHLEDSPSAKWTAGTAYTDPNDSRYLVRDVDARVTGEVTVTASTSVTIDADSNPVIAMDDDSPAGAISVSLDSSVEDGFIRDVFNQSTNDATLTPTSGDINDGTGAASSASLPAGTSCRLSKTSSGSPATANWRMLKGAGSGGSAPSGTGIVEVSGGSFVSPAALTKDTDKTFAANSDSRIPTQKAVAQAIQQEANTYAADSGSANAYAVTLSPAPTIVAGSTVTFKATNANTGASTLDVNGGGAVAIKKNGSSALVANDISAGQMVTVKYDGSTWQIVAGAIGPVGPAGGGGIWPSLTPPVSTNFTWSNQLTATVTDKSDRMIMVAGGGSNANALFDNTALPATPYTVDLGFISHANPGTTGAVICGIALKSSGGALRTYSLRNPGNASISLRDAYRSIQAWTSITSPGSEVVTGPPIENVAFLSFLRITDDGTTRTYYWSHNGKDFAWAASEATNTGITPATAGIVLFDTNSTVLEVAVIYHWKISSSVLPQFA